MCIAHKLEAIKWYNYVFTVLGNHSIYYVRHHENFIELDMKLLLNYIHQEVSLRTWGQFFWSSIHLNSV